MTEKFPVARCLYVGVTLLGFTEPQVWRMTPKKLYLLYIEHLKENGTYKEPTTAESFLP